MTKNFLFVIVTFLSLCFSISFKTASIARTSTRRSVLVVNMGRAAAVRAATKAKTDSAKAKRNNVYAKKIIQVELLDFFKCFTST